MASTFTHPRDVPCPVCGAQAGFPCLLRSGKPVPEIHCTDRVAAASGTELLIAPSAPFAPGTPSPEPAPAPPGLAAPEAEPGSPVAEDPAPHIGPEPSTEQTDQAQPKPATGRAGAPRRRRLPERPGKSRQAQPSGGSAVRASPEPQPALF